MDEITVSFGIKKKHRYYAKEEMSLGDFERFLEKYIPKKNTTKFSMWERLTGRDKIYKNENLEFENYKKLIIQVIKQTMEYDGPGKKVLK